MRDRPRLRHMRRLAAVHEAQCSFGERELSLAREEESARQYHNETSARAVDDLIADWKARLIGGGVDPHALSAYAFMFEERRAQHQAAADALETSRLETRRAGEQLALYQARVKQANKSTRKLKRRISSRAEEAALAHVEAALAYKWVRS
ncbi:MAG: hypothetical protein H7124_05530 [Phycisphaerales bacterium]|nr:hypothetical protein [Hyphomonadaceae bacterium]